MCSPMPDIDLDDISDYEPDHIDRLYNRFRDVTCEITIGPGWEKLVTELDEKLREIDPYYTVSQIKEKYGKLRYYADPSDYSRTPRADQDGFFQAIWQAEQDSATICEECGAPGELGQWNGYWWLTACEEHRGG